MEIYLKPMSHQSGVLTVFPQRLKNADRRGARCANASNAGRTDRPTDRPTVGRTRQSKSIIAHMIKTCVGDMKWTRSDTNGKTDGHCR